MPACSRGQSRSRRHPGGLEDSLFAPPTALSVQIQQGITELCLFPQMVALAAGVLTASAAAPSASSAPSEASEGQETTLDQAARAKKDAG